MDLPSPILSSPIHPLPQSPSLLFTDSTSTYPIDLHLQQPRVCHFGADTSGEGRGKHVDVVIEIFLIVVVFGWRGWGTGRVGGSGRGGGWIGMKEVRGVVDVAAGEADEGVGVYSLVARLEKNEGVLATRGNLIAHFRG